MADVRSSALTERERIHAPVGNYLLWRMTVILVLVIESIDLWIKDSPPLRYS